MDILYWGYGEQIETNEVVVVGLDRRTFAETGLDFPRFFPMYKKIVQRLTRAEAKAIAFDIGLSTAPSKEAAEEFTTAVENGPPFFIASSLPAQGLSQPERPVSKNEKSIIKSKAIRRGYVDLLRPTIDGPIVRRLALTTERNGHSYHSFAYTIWKNLTGKELPRESEDYFRIPFKGANGGIPYISCADLLKGPKELDLAFKSRVVLLGPEEVWFQDYHQTPVGRTLGVQIHANMVQALLRDIRLKRPNPVVLFLAVSLPLLFGLLFYHKTKPPVSYSLVLMAAVLILVLSTLLAKHGFWLPPLTPLLALLSGFFIPMVVFTSHEALEGLVVKRLFGQFVSQEVFQAIMRDRTGLRLDGVSIEATVLFSDIRGFTTLSEELGPDNTFTILNEYFGEMVDVIFRNGGRLDKFIGDAIMAVYGAPFSQPDDVLRAVKSAHEMQQRLRSLNKVLAQQGKPELTIGVGLATGLVHAGVIGTSEKMEYAVIGDTVNTASRLEHLTKELGVSILMSEGTYEAVKDHVEAIDLGEQEIRGKQGKLRVYGLINMD